MKITLKLLTGLGIFAAAVLSSGSTVADYAPGELLVKFQPGVSGTTIGAVNREVGATVLDIIPHLNVQHVRLPQGTTVEEGLSFYRGLTSIAYAEPNYREHLTFTPNDTQFSSMWGMAKIHAPEAWDLGRGVSTVITAVIDTGIDLNHEDFAGKLVTGYDFSDNDPDPTYSDPHGVHTAGTVGAATNNGKGVAGVSFNCKVMPLKIFPNATDVTSATAIMYAADHGAKAISMSYGSAGMSQTEKDATDYAWSHGVVLCAAAGNDNSSSLFYPSSFPHVIGIGSTGPTDQKSGFSNFGADHVSVAAPGEGILSTFPGNTYVNLDGTSMACPHVAGLAALLFSFAPPGTTNLQVRTAIESTTDPVGNWVRFGRINAFRAMMAFNVASEVIYHAIDVQPLTGTNPAGDVSALAASDNQFYSLTSVPQTSGQIASDVVTLGISDSLANLRSAKLIFEANAPLGASNQMYFWNFFTGRWDISKASSLRPSGPNRVTLTLPNNLTAFVSGGQMRILTRGILPNRPLNRGGGAAPVFTYQVGFVELRVRPGN